MAQAQRMFSSGPMAAAASSQSGTASPRPVRVWWWQGISQGQATPFPPTATKLIAFGRLRGGGSPKPQSPQICTPSSPVTPSPTPVSIPTFSNPKPACRDPKEVSGDKGRTGGRGGRGLFAVPQGEEATVVVPASSQQSVLASRTELIVERILHSEGNENRTERQVITDPLIIAAYCRERPIYDKRRDARRVNYKDTPITLRRKRQPKDGPDVTCTACGMTGHTRASRSCPRYGESREGLAREGKLLRSGDLPLEQTGLRMGEDGKICITKASLERVDASMRQQMRMVIPLKSIKESGVIATTKAAAPPQRDDKDERRALRAEAASALAKIFLDIVDELLKHPLVDPFARPVSKKKYPMYYRLIPKPRDLATIRKKLLIQQQMHVARSAKTRPRYNRGSQFMADLELIHSNCLVFNGADHVFTKTTAELLEMAQRMYKERVEEIRELEKVILGEKYSEEEEPAGVSANEDIKVDGDEDVERDGFESSMQPASQSPYPKHPMTELERMVMELGGHTVRETKAALSPVAPSERSPGEGSPRGEATGSQMTDEVAGKIRLKLFLRK